MSSQTTLKKLEQQIVLLPIQDQLKLIARISELLSMAQLDSMMAVEDQRALIKQREKEADELLRICDTAAEQWEGDFNAELDIRQIRQKRDEQIWQNK
ncbi:MAG: hypothetical protein ONB16_12810 [candidate division KSB1 bacterium]|nr:hypothetical protein [candidate division KSB1 bacterium]MDZ7319212.1 hypothetical protein [candidate division KSB1 bacterium]